MLVTLGSNSSIASGASQTFQYACNSVQSVFIRCNDDGTDSLKGNVTVQIGNDVICNDINFHGLGFISLLNGGGKVGTDDAYFKIDFGSHILEPLENLYVTIRATGAMTAIDVSAIVNEGGVYEPLKYTNYSDSVFTDANTLAVYAWADASLEDDTTAFTIRNQAYSATPQVQSGVLQSLSQVQGEHDSAKYVGIMAKNQVPLDTSINYSSTTIDGVICVSAMAKTPSKAQASGQAGRAVLGAMTSSERKAL
jgi:hypothetical protein